MAETRRTARDAAVEQAVSTLVYVAISVAISVAFMKRETIWAWCKRLTFRPMPEAEARIEREVAEFRQEMSGWPR